MYFSPSLIWLFPLSFLIGFTSVVPQIFVPMASELAEPAKKSQAIGMVMSGLLVGILLSRVLSGFIGEFFRMACCLFNWCCNYVYSLDIDLHIFT